jgi:hypothetical protein
MGAERPAFSKGVGVAEMHHVEGAVHPDAHLPLRRGATGLQRGEFPTQRLNFRLGLLQLTPQDTDRVASAVSEPQRSSAVAHQKRRARASEERGE